MANFDVTQLTIQSGQSATPSEAVVLTAASTVMTADNHTVMISLGRADTDAIKLAHPLGTAMTTFCPRPIPP